MLSYVISFNFDVCVTFVCFFFFFSSRRRHTRYWRDWSSDVCSSDLSLQLVIGSVLAEVHRCAHSCWQCSCICCGSLALSNVPSHLPLHPLGRLPQRSEEHTSELQSRQYLVCRLLLEKKQTSKITCRRRDVMSTGKKLS